MTTIPISTATTTVSALASLTAQVPPVTTVFTAPATCSSNWVYQLDRAGTVWNDLGFLPDFSLCQPYNNLGTVYAPGICSSGLELKQVTKIVETGSDSTTTNWHGICCSPDFSISVTYESFSFCVGSFSSPFTALVSLGDIDNPSVSFTPTVLSSQVRAISDLFEVYWHETDVALFPTDSQLQLKAIMGLPTAISGVTTAITAPSQPLSGSITTTASATTSPQSTSTGTGMEMQKGLSKGAIAGISIAVVIAVIVIAVFSYFTWFRRYRWRSSSQGSPNSRQRSLLSRLPEPSTLNVRSPPRAVTPITSAAELESPPGVGMIFKSGAWRTELHCDPAELEASPRARTSFKGGAWRTELHYSFGAARKEKRESQEMFSILGEGRTRKLNFNVSSHYNSAPVELEGSYP